MTLWLFIKMQRRVQVAHHQKVKKALCFAWGYFDWFKLYKKNIFFYFDENGVIFNFNIFFQIETNFLLIRHFQKLVSTTFFTHSPFFSMITIGKKSESCLQSSMLNGGVWCTEELPRGGKHGGKNRKHNRRATDGWTRSRTCRAAGVCGKEKWRENKWIEERKNWGAHILLLFSIISMMHLVF